MHALADALANGEIEEAVSHASILLSGLGSPTGDADAAMGIEHLVRAVVSNRAGLLRLRAIAPELKRAVKNPWRIHGVAVDRGAALSQLSASDLRSVRLDPTLTVAITTDGILGRAQLTDDAAVFSHARRNTARIEGPSDRLALLLDVVAGGQLTPEDLLSVKLPVSVRKLDEHLERRQSEVDALLESGRKLVETIERLVCRIYGVPDDLTELVIASATSRAGTIAAGDE